MALFLLDVAKIILYRFEAHGVNLSELRAQQDEMMMFPD
jgi:hypothetical protein